MFQWGDNIIAVIFNAPIKNEENCRALYIQQVFPAYTPPIMLRHTTGPQFNMCVEKDWSPIGPAKDHIVDYAEGFLFAYSIEPTHRVIRCHLTGSCETVASTDSSAILKYYRELFANVSNGRDGLLNLGTNAVRLSEKYYGSILHFKIPVTGPAPQQAIYYNLAYTFAATHPYQIVKVGMKPLVLPEPDERSRCGFTCATGLTFLQGKLSVMYSCDQTTASMYFNTVNGIFEHMVDVNDLAEATRYLTNGNNSISTKENADFPEQPGLKTNTQATIPLPNDLICRQNQGRNCSQLEKV
jgi:hypothetical protein